MKTGPKPRFLNDLFWEKVDKKGKDECWEWISTIQKQNGRGIMRANQKNYVAQRASWIIHFGDIPKGKSVLNTCKNNLCVNPNHLFLGSHKDRNCGNNKRIPFEKRFWEKVIKKGDNECWEWSSVRKSSFGYGQLKVNGKNEDAHRVSWFIHHGEIPKGMFVLHKCDNPACVNPNHLYIGDHLDNMRDKVERGRCNSLKGEKNHNSKLTEEQVKYIKNRKYAIGDITKVARQYGVTKHTISSILHNKNWKHI